jgi:hypothetical protein
MSGIYVVACDHKKTSGLENNNGGNCEHWFEKFVQF